jgi:hypothetical protein
LNPPFSLIFFKKKIVVGVVGKNKKINSTGDVLLSRMKHLHLVFTPGPVGYFSFFSCPNHKMNKYDKRKKEKINI